LNKKNLTLTFFLFIVSALGTAFGQTALEQRVVDLINIERAKHDLPQFIWHDTLAAIARTHSEDMLRNNFVSITSSDGSGGLQRIRQGGITRVVGQNTLVYGGGNTPEQRVATWMENSRAAILHEDRSFIGIGIVQRPAGFSANNSSYWTLMIIQIPLEMSPSEIRAFEMRVFELTNIERAKHGFPALIWHDNLAAASRALSEDIMRNNLGTHTGSGHTGSDDSTARQRIERAGVTNGRYWSENISYGRRTPEAVVDGWMNSPGHRANILNSSPTHLGVGLIQRPEGSNARFSIYVVQNFCAFR